jgi:hypothetical protein
MTDQVTEPTVGADPQDLIEPKSSTVVSFEDDEPEKVEKPEPVAEAPKVEDEDEEVRAQFTPEQQAKFDEVIARKTAKFRAQQRQLEAQLNELKSQAPQKADEKPVIPPAPDPWDAEYETKFKARDEAIQKAALWEYQQQQKEQARTQQEQQTQQQAAQELQRAVTTYSSRALKQGITSDQLRQAGDLVTQMGIHPHVQLYVLGEETGPSITMYLAKNLHEIEKINAMLPVQAAAYIASNVIPKATKSATSGTPPPRSVSGRSPGAAKERGPKNATYE